jgi:hypothetical protein
MEARSAPRAMRMPISCVLSATRSEMRDLAKPVSLKEQEVKQIDLVVKPLRSQ